MSGYLVGNSSMTEAEVIVKKQDCALQTKKSHVWIITAEGYVEEVKLKVAKLCGTICKEMQSGLGCCINNPIPLPPAIKPTFLHFVFDYCLYHHLSGSSYKRNAFDENLLEMDANILCELIYVAHYLQIKSLIDRTYEVMVKKIESISSLEGLYHLLNCPDDVTKEEHLSWIKVLRRLITEKNKEKKGSEKLKILEVVSKPRHHEDTRSIDDLLAFIDGGDGDSKGARTSKKKKNRKKRDGQKNNPSPCAASSSNKACILTKQVEGPDEISTQDSNAFEATSHGVQSSSISTMVVDKLKLSNARDKSFTFEDNSDNGDFDPSMSEELDREVEDFALRLIAKEPIIYFDSSSQRKSDVSVKRNGS